MEGYVESIASGYVCAINAVQMYNGKEKIIFDEDTIIGSLANYISTSHEYFQPMNANFGLFNTDRVFKSKQEKNDFYANRSIEKIKEKYV